MNGGHCPLATLGPMLALLLGPQGASASATKAVLAEDYTATWCATCAHARCGLAVVQGEFGDQLIILEHHVQDILSNSWTDSRILDYGVGVAIPRVWFDGTTYVSNVGSCSEAADAYRAKINERLAATGGVSPVAITGWWTCDDESLTVRAVFHKVEAVTLPDPRAYLVVVEDGVECEGTTYNNVTRAGCAEDVLLAAPGDSAVVEVRLPREEGWNAAGLGCVAFLESVGAEREVHQVGRLTHREDFAFAFDRPIGSVAHCPGAVALRGTLTNTGATAEQFTIALENTFGWLARFRVEGEPDFHGGPCAWTLGPGENCVVDLQVYTDEEVRTGTGHLVVSAASSGLAFWARALVFNGSPAILLVDDDYANDDEELLVDALAAKGYLYHPWNVLIDHLGHGPLATDLCGYDVVLWHTGWISWDLLTSEDVTALRSYMDDGGAFLLSSQEYLSTSSSYTFRRDYLGVASWTTDVGANAGVGTAGDPIGDGLSFALDYPTSTYNKADDLSPSASAEVILRSDQDDRIAVRATNANYRSVFLAYGINAMDPELPDPDNPATLLDRSLQWLIGGTLTVVPDPREPVSTLRLRLQTGDPWRPAAGAACWELLGSPADAVGTIHAEIYGAEGRRVCRLPEQPGTPPCARVRWDGRDRVGRPVPAGTYFLRVVAPGGTSRTRVLIVR